MPDSILQLTSVDNASMSSTPSASRWLAHNDPVRFKVKDQLLACGQLGALFQLNRLWAAANLGLIRCRTLFMCILYLSTYLWKAKSILPDQVPTIKLYTTIHYSILVYTSRRANIFCHGLTVRAYRCMSYLVHAHSTLHPYNTGTRSKPSIKGLRVAIISNIEILLPTVWMQNPGKIFSMVSHLSAVVGCWQPPTAYGPVTVS